MTNPAPLSPTTKELETFEFLDEWFAYDTSSPSCLVWKKRRPYSPTKQGDPITYKTNYYIVEINQKRLRCHRIVLILHGILPTAGQVVDHVNQDRLDNRVENLRWVSSRQNNYNKKTKAKSGFRYVGITAAGRFRSQYRSPVTGISVCCGTYDTAYEAYVAALSHKLQNYWNP